MGVYKKNKFLMKCIHFFMAFLVISFFRISNVSAYFQFNRTSTINFTTLTYQNLSLATDRTTYGLCNKSATIYFTVGNLNAYNIGYTITFSNSSLTYTIDGAAVSSYTLPASGSRTHTIVVSGTTSTTSLDIIVTPNSPYASTHTKNVTLDLVCPSCTWGTLSDLTATLTNTYALTCTDAHGVVSKTLTTSDIISSDTSKATVTSISAPTIITNGYKYTVTATGVAIGTFTLSLKASMISDNNSNLNVVSTSNSINVIRRAPDMIVSATSSTLNYGGSTGSLTYTYTGNAVPTVSSSVPGVATVSINTTNKTIIVTPITAGNTVVTISSTATNQYAATSKTVNVGVNKIAVTYTAGSTSKTYDGTALTLPSTCSITSGALLSGHTATCTNTGTITNYTSGGVANVLSAVVIRDASSNDVTSNYAITKVNGTLTINKRNVTYKAGSTSKTYDGTALTYPSTCSLTAGTLVSGHIATCTNSGTITNYTSGGVTNTLSTVVIKNGTTDVSNNYNVTKQNGTLTINKRAVTYKAGSTSKTYDGTALTYPSTCSLTSGTLVSGHAATCTNSGTITNYGSTTNTLSTVVIKNSGGTDITSNYAVTKANGTLTINKRAVTVTAGTTSKTYDGSTLTYATCTGNNLVSGQTVTCTMTTGSAITNVGNVANTISTVVIKNGTTDVTSNYTVTNATGTLTITRALTATTGSCSNLTYTGSTQTLASGAGNASYTNNSGTNATSYTVTVTAGSNYAFSDGTTSKTLSCSIGKKVVTYTAGSTSKTYDGSALTYPSTCSITSGSIVSGHVATCTNSGTITNYGSTTNTLSIVVIKNSGGTDITSNYAVTKVNGTLTINKRNVTYTAGSTSKTYDGSALTYPSTCSITSGSIVSGHVATCANSGTITNKGSSTNTLSTVVIKSGSTDVSGNYNVTKANGTLTINARAVTVTAGSTSRTYNGSALTLSTCTGNNLLSGQTVTCAMTTGSTITNVGSIANTISTVSIKSGSTDVTTNYTVTNANGTLSITRALTATTGSCVSRTYNGSAQTLASGASNASYTNNSGTNATSYTVTVTAGSNYAFSDGTTSKTLSCSIGKRTCNLTLSATSGTVLVGSSITFTEKSTNCTGTFSNTSNNTGYATVSPSTSGTINTNTASNATIYGISNGSTTITVRINPSDTANNNAASGTYTVSSQVPARTYTATFVQNGAGSIGATSRSCTIAQGNTATSCSITSPTISGSSATPTVIGWDRDSANGHANDLSPNTVVSISEDRKYYAQTRSNPSTFTATFYKNTASTIDWSSSSSLTRTCTTSTTYNGVTPPSSCTVTTPSIERSGYVVCGWGNSGTNPTGITGVSTSISLSYNINFYAITGLRGANFDILPNSVGLYNMYSIGFTSYTNGKLMYRGPSPSNYFLFNCTNVATNANCERWRILAIEADDRIELINYNSNRTSAWRSTSTDWYYYGSTVQLYQESYYQSSITADTKNYVVYEFLYDNKSINYDSGSVTVNTTIAEEVNGGTHYYLALPRITDYLVTSTSVSPTTNWNGINGSSKWASQNNWMYDSTRDYFFINKHAKSTGDGPRVQVASNGSVSKAGVISRYTAKYVKDVAHLKVGTFVLGTGTWDNPYYICPVCSY